MSKPYYSLSANEAIKHLDSSRDGLADDEAQARLSRHGSNELKKEKKATALIIFLDQFKNAFVILLICASIISLFLHEYVESIAMFSLILLSAILGFIQEYRAEKAMEALQKRSSLYAKVLRNGNIVKVPAKDIVPGDIVLLEAGDVVPADLRLFECSNLQIDESSLTGESVPPKKHTEHLKEGTIVSDQKNMAFMGSIVTYGKGRGVVTKTGMETELGKIAHSIQETEDTQTPLQVKFSRMAKQIGMAVVLLVIVLSSVRVFQGEDNLANLFLVALSLIVAAVPNALPVIVTVSLSMGSKTLAKKNMLIKKLPAAESLGSVTIICSDKTGTLTRNEMTVTKLFVNDEIIDVTGTGYKPEGTFHTGGKAVNPKKFELLLRISHLCNNANLVFNEEVKSGKYEIIGDPTEGSLIVLSYKGKVEEEYIHKNFSVIEELSFDSDRKRMTVVVDNKIDKKKEAYVKGAPDLLLKVCDRILIDGRVKKITKEEKEKILKTTDGFAEGALRVLAFAYREVPHNIAYSVDSVEKDLIFVGLAGMMDPAREEVRKAVAECRTAGIEVMIITGDHALTTKAVAKEIGLFNEGDLVISGEELDRMDDRELSDKIDRIRIIARALPIQKSRIVDILQRRGHIVAMTGDGVNDAPALKKADIGIAMGITGTDVAKEVSKAILVDDNFATIVNAVSEGRNVYDKMMRSVRYLLSCNMGEIMSVLIAVALSLPLPMVPLQILLMNLLTDGLPAIGLGFEKPEKDIMMRPPRNPKERPITTNMFVLILIFGLVMGIGTIFMFSLYYESQGLVKAQTVAFTTLVVIELFAVMSSKSWKISSRDINPFSNLWLLGAIIIAFGIQLLVVYVRPLQAAFGTAPLELIDWLRILGIAAICFVVMEASKLFTKFDGIDIKKKETLQAKNIA